MKGTCGLFQNVSCEEPESSSVFPSDCMCVSEENYLRSFLFCFVFVVAFCLSFFPV